MAISTITYAVDKVKTTWAYLETVMPAAYNELNRVVMDLVTNNNLVQGELDTKAPIESPTFTGEPKAPTPIAGDNSEKISTTAWIKNNIQSLVAGCISAVATTAGFTYSFNTNGYIKLPTWLGGLIIQWGYSAESSGNTDFKFFPIMFPTACWGLYATQNKGASNNSTWVDLANTTCFLIGCGGDFTNLTPNPYIFWFAIGY